MTNTDNIYGNYNPLAQIYTKVRRGYPAEVLDWCHQVILGESALVLDVGCGTGISTRQLAESGFRVVGTDISEHMIAEAKSHGGNIDYTVAPASKLPFENNFFDGATAFTAFHWFNTPEAMAELYRVLKPGGAFAVVHRKEAESFSLDYRGIVEGYAGRPLPSVYENFDPANTLGTSEFANIQVKQFDMQEERELENYISYFESTSLWNYIPEDKKPEAKQELHDHFAKLFPNGTVVRKLNITLVAGFKV